MLVPATPDTLVSRHGTLGIHAVPPTEGRLMSTFRQSRDQQLQSPDAERSRPKPSGITAPTVTLFKVRGIAIGAHWSWLFVFLLISWMLSTQLFPIDYPGLQDRTYLIMGVTSALVFFLSILLHELGHAFQALKENMRVSDITLWLFGGVARFEGMFPSAGAEFRIAIAGPVVSLLLAIGFWAAAAGGGAVGFPAEAVAVADYLATINFIVLAFNLVPALPLDGGRVLRAWLWHRQRNFTAATLSAARAGKTFAYLLMTLGFLGFFSQAFVGGIWFVLLGFFILQAAEGEAQYARLRAIFQRFEVQDLMSPEPATVDPDRTIDELFELMLAPGGYSTYPVVENGRLAGLVSARMAGNIPADRRGATRIREAMLGPDGVPVLDRHTPMMQALESLRDGPGRAVVLDNGSVSGILSISDVAKAIELEQARGFQQEPGTRKAGSLVWLVVGMLMLLAVSAFYRPPLAVISSGEAINVSDGISIEGVPSEPVNGEYLLLAVSITQPSALGALAAAIDPGRSVVPVSSLIPDGISGEEYWESQTSIFRESQMLAAGAAAEAAGLSVTLGGSGARVLGLVPGSPAEGQLQSEDLITEVNGAPISLAADLRRAVSAQAPGTEFNLTVIRDGREQQIGIASANLDPRQQSAPGLGVLVSTEDFQVDLPFEIAFAELEVGGPSAGLAYALAIADMLDSRDLTAGRTVGASGTISVEGEVGPVGGVNQKASAARDSGADLLMVPRQEVAQVRGAGDLTVRGVDNLQEALGFLAQSS